jgi:acetyl-CoA carboxylase carboxyltransferase component
MRAGAERRGIEVDEEALAAGTQAVEDQIERESDAFVASGELWDDGMIDPRDTRTVLGMALSAACSAEVAGSRRFGVFRM